MSFQLSSMAECTEMVSRRRSPSRSGRLAACTADGDRRKRDEVASDQTATVAFLIRQWTKELGGGLIKEIWARSGAKVTDRVVMRLDRGGPLPRGPFGDATTQNDRN